MVSAFSLEVKKCMNKLAVKELMRSKEEKRILIVKISEIEDEYYKLKNENIIKNR